MRSLHRYTVGLLMMAIAAAAGCKRPAPPDAYGNDEATAVVVGAETGGRLVSFDVNEGDTLSAETVVGTIDAVELGLQRDQLTAQRGANASRVNEVAQQIDVLQAQRRVAEAQRDAAKAQKSALDAQREIAGRAYERTQRLIAQQAATAQQLDQAERDVRVLEQQIKAQAEQVKAQESQIQAHTQQIEATRAQQQTARSQETSAAAQIAQVTERMRKSQINNPIAGTVLTTYAKAGEFVQPGQPLYKIANLDSVEVRAYVTEPQLGQVKIGVAARITIDVAGGPRRSLPGAVSWISSEAEFTPTPIQTREERADLVYAVKIRVPNEGGVLKIGMPADVQFETARAGQ
jgi:HlyD family secretion protein